MSYPSRDRDIRKKLLSWFDREKRPMPWRDDPSPYKVWISEIMLQQTQVATVIPHFENFLERFPTLGSLAEAEEEEVLARWSGLGYYSRARNLHAAAKRIARERNGELPSEPAELAALPGVGRYTAGAIASIAFGRSAPSVDGNQARVLARLEALGGDPSRNPLKAELWAGAGRLVDCDRPGDLNQALMELGARVCKPAAPSCDSCPVAAECLAGREGRALDFPGRRPRQTAEAVKVEVGIFLRGERVLLSRGERPFLGKLWNLPYRVREGGSFPHESWRDLGIEVSRRRHLGEHRRSITRYRINQEAVSGEAELLVGENLPEYRWVPRAELGELGLPTFSSALLKRYVGEKK